MRKNVERNISLHKQHRRNCNGKWRLLCGQYEWAAICQALKDQVTEINLQWFPLEELSGAVPNVASSQEHALS